MRSWAEMPTDRVVRLTGTTFAALLTRLSTRPEGAPATVIFDAHQALSLPESIAAFLQVMESSAIGAYPDWLPEAKGITGAGGSGANAVRSIARRAAAAGGHYAPFLVDLAIAALTGRTLARVKFSPELRAAGLKRVTAAAAGRRAVAVVCRLRDELPVDAEPALIAAAEWLADHAGAGVWLIGRPLVAVDHIVALDVGDQEDLPRLVARLAVVGSPHHGSRTERMLEAALRRCDWAFGRAWNQTYQSGSLANSVRLDLVWTAERCVVEIDGDEHRSLEHYAADRRRDVDLQLDGFAVLRFTNQQLHDDLWNVVTLIERYVRARRLGAREGRRDVGQGSHPGAAVGTAGADGRRA